MTTTDELQEVMQEVSSYYKFNLLTNRQFATAAWSLLAFAENMMLNAHTGTEGTHRHAMIGDKLVNDLKYPIGWLYHACEPGGQVPFTSNYKVDRYQANRASRDLLRLGGKYRWFVFANTYFRHRWIGLEFQGTMIQPTKNLFADIEYNAYNRLIKPNKLQQASSLVNLDNLPMAAIKRSLKINGDRFKCNPNPKMVSDTIEALIKPRLDVIFSLPNEWQFSCYTLEDFRKVFEVISAMAYIRTRASHMAADEECVGYVDHIYVLTPSELLGRVVRYSGVSDVKVRSIFNHLSYGNEGISHPDPALQPLIKLNSDAYAIMPHLWLYCSPERNLTVLLNRFSAEKSIYEKLVSKKEELMRKRFTICLSAKGFRFCWGNVLDLPPDIDLAIISDSEKACLLLELKWFIYPAEAVEVIRRSGMIKKGISQVLQLKQAFVNNHEPLLKKLKIDSSYRLEGVVVSENWIGNAQAQSPKVPVIQADHLIDKLKHTENLRSTMEWLTDRKYLPKEGEHFKVKIVTHTIGDWRLKWYEIQLPSSDASFPL